MLIVEYRKSWQEDFNSIKDELTGVLSIEDINIEHIGSTAVKGLAAKPIIDIDLIYCKSDQFNVIAKKLRSIGYFHKGYQGIPGRDAFKRKNEHTNHPVLDSIAHHLYVCHSSSIELKRHITFRDKLRNDKDAQMSYERLKREIADMALQDKKQYALLKEGMAQDFIEDILKQP